MFRKIRSNRDPRDTLYSELKKEFKVYTDKANQWSKAIAFRYPKLLFGFMVSMIIVSAAMAVLLHQTQLPQSQINKNQKPAPSVLGNGFDNILAANAALRRTIELRGQVDSISAKNLLTANDSLVLVRALDSLQHIQLALPH